MSDVVNAETAEEIFVQLLSELGISGPITLNDYQDRAKRTMMPLSQQQKMLYLALGLNGEAGEVAEAIKKAYFHGHELDRIALAKELGDVMWYIAVLSDELGFPLVEIAQMNITKLRARYPNGFSQEKSRNREE